MGSEKILNNILILVLVVLFLANIALYGFVGNVYLQNHQQKVIYSYDNIWGLFYDSDNESQIAQSEAVVDEEILEELIEDEGAEVDIIDDVEKSTADVAEVAESGPEDTTARVIYDSEIEFTEEVYSQVDLPLYAKDYYWGKYINGKAGAAEINKIGEFQPGDQISLIGDGYITLRSSAGYISPARGYYYGSGLCWSVSALGYLMDVVNPKFNEEFGIDLFLLPRGSRYPHSKKYISYGPSNNGYGYSIIKRSNGGTVDYKFQINPEVKNIPELRGATFRIEMYGNEDYDGAYNGENIGAKLIINRGDF